MATYEQTIAALRNFRYDLIRKKQTASVPGPSDLGFTPGVMTAFRGAYAAYRSPLANVHATGIGVRVSAGEVVRPLQYVLKVFVFDKPGALELDQPLDKEFRDERFGPIPIDVSHMPVQIVRVEEEEGPPRPARAPRRRHGLAMAESAAGPSIQEHQQRRRAIPGGVSISPFQAPYVGTLGCFLRRQSSNSEEYFALSNNHVLSDLNRLVETTTYIVQPGPEAPRYKTDLNDAFARLFRSIPIRFPGDGIGPVVNRFDAAIATVIDSNDLARDEITRHGTLLGISNYDPTSVRTPLPGMLVAKSGRSTGVTTGMVISTHVNGIQVNYGTQASPRIAVFDDTVEIRSLDGRPFSLPGDSGAIIVEKDTGHPVAVLFAGDGVTTTAFELGALCQELEAWPV